MRDLWFCIILYIIGSMELYSKAKAMYEEQRAKKGLSSKDQKWF